MYSKFIKLVVLLSLLVCCAFAGRVLYSRFFNLAVQGKDPRHNLIVLFFGLDPAQNAMAVYSVPRN